MTVLRDCDWTTFQVSVVGEFPFDMLRADSCWPYQPEDVAAMVNDGSDGRRVVTLATWDARAPNRRRWKSFSCLVLACSHEDDDQ